MIRIESAGRNVQRPARRFCRLIGNFASGLHCSRRGIERAKLENFTITNDNRLLTALANELLVRAEWIPPSRSPGSRVPARLNRPLHQQPPRTWLSPGRLSRQPLPLELLLRLSYCAWFDHLLRLDELAKDSLPFRFRRFVSCV